MINVDTSKMVDMGEFYDHELEPCCCEGEKDRERKPHYPDIYGLNIEHLEAIQQTKVGEDVIIVIKANVKSMEVRDSEKSGKKATACLEIREAAAYPVEKKEEMLKQNKEAGDEDLPKKGDSNFVDTIFGKQDNSEEEDDAE